MSNGKGVKAIIEANRAQIESEVDSFTEERYCQMAMHFPSSTQDLQVLDVGCNTGRGGRILKKITPRITPHRLGLCRRAGVRT